jgi:hypothetical protein
MSYTSEEIRSLSLQWLARAKKNNPNLQPSCDKIANGLRQMVSPEGNAPGLPFDEGDLRRLTYVLWDLMFDRLIIFGRDDPSSNTGWPFFTVTDHGWKVIHSTAPIPYDPDGYLTGLSKVAIGVHPTAIRYTEEALATFRAGCYLSSAVMLGAASERIFFDVAESMALSHTSPADEASFREKAQRRKMRDNLNKVIGWCRDKREQLDGAWKDEERVEVFNQLAHLIRHRRNDAGHPQDPPAAPSRDHMYASLVVWPDYCKWVYELKADLDSKRGKIT